MGVGKKKLFAETGADEMNKWMEIETKSVAMGEVGVKFVFPMQHRRTTVSCVLRLNSTRCSFPRGISVDTSGERRRQRFLHH